MKDVLLKNGQTLIIRKAIKDDVPGIIEYMAVIGGESDYLTFGENELSIAIDQQEHIVTSLNNSDNSIMVVALLNNEIIGLASFRGGERKRVRHAGEFGVTVRRSAWGLGIGDALMRSIIDWAKDTQVIRKINLRVRSDNEKAIRLYEKFGFIREGILTRDYCIEGEFFDSIQMGLAID